MKSSGKEAGATQRVRQPHKDALLKRLNRISGQVRGVAGMIEEERYCVDVRAGRGEQAVDEFMTVVKRLSR